MEASNDYNEATTKAEPVKAISKSGYLVKVMHKKKELDIVFVEQLFSYQVYDATEEILLNTMVEFIGIYYDHGVVKADSAPSV